MSKNKRNKRNVQPSQPIRHAPPPPPRLAPEIGVGGHPNEDRPLTLTPEGLRRLEVARAELAKKLDGVVQQIEKIKRDGDAEIARLTQQARQLEAMIYQQDGGIQTMQLLLSGLPENRIEVDKTPLGAPSPNGPSIPAGMMPPPAAVLGGNGANGAMIENGF